MRGQLSAIRVETGGGDTCKFSFPHQPSPGGWVSVAGIVKSTIWQKFQERKRGQWLSGGYYIPRSAFSRCASCSPPTLRC